MNGIIAGIFTVSYMGFSIYKCRGLKLNIKNMVLCGLVCALTVLLSCIYITLPTGGSFTLGSCVPIIIMALIIDYRLAIVSGWVSGILCLILVPVWQPVHWAQIFVEHLVCFSCLGYAGVFGIKSRWRVLAGTVVALLIKLAGHIMSGVVFFATNAWDGWGSWAYSVAYNGSLWAPELIITLVIVAVLPLKVLKRALGKNV